MKNIILNKFIAILMTIFILLSLSSNSVAVEVPTNKEIIIKYKDSVIMNSDKLKSMTKIKHGIEKLKKKKDIKLSNQILEVLEVAQNEDIEKLVQRLSNQPEFELVQENYRITQKKSPSIKVKDPRFNEQWGLKNSGQKILGQNGVENIDINVQEAWKVTGGSSNVLVGILDTGIDINHKDLKPSIFVNKKEISGNGIDDDGNGYIDDVNGWDFVNNRKNVYDSIDIEHGTHIAGIISAKNNKLGISGVAPKAKILPLKFIEDENGYISDLIEAIEYGRNLDVKIFNCSFAFPKEDKLLKNIIKNTDAIFVCAAGNYGLSSDYVPFYPASYNLPNVVSVNSINNKGELSFFSNCGQKVHIAAPGENILSTIPNNEYGYNSGTSMSAPFVTGIAALIQSKNPSISGIEMAKKIKIGVKKRKNLMTKVFSGGFVDAYKCLN